jgi:F-type H+-transporting ATPase subunit delta
VARRIYARRYARAVFDIALERKKLDKWQSDLKKIAALGEDSALLALMESPKVGFADKAKLLAERLGKTNPLALNLVYLLVTRGRLSMAAEIAEEYQRLLDNYRGIEHAEVITAIPLDDKDKKKLEEHLGAVVGKKVIVKTKVDSSIIGGIVARIDGKLLDGSTHSKLIAMRDELASGEAE